MIRTAISFRYQNGSFWRKSKLVSRVQTLSTATNDALSRIRNVGVVAHIDAGKTTTSEQMLYISGETKIIGRVDTGDTVLDFLPQERERGITISSAAVTFSWKNHHVNLIDTPGHVDFTIEVERSARVLDGAILVIDGVAGVQAQTQTVWKQIKKNKVSTIAFINKMDRDGASFEREKKLNATILQIQIPLGSENGFYGVIDLCSMTQVTWGTPYENTSSRSPPKPVYISLPTFQELLVITKNSSNRKDYSTEEIELYQYTWNKRKEMIENLASIDEILMDKYLSLPPTSSNGDENSVITTEDIQHAIRRSCISGQLIPALCGASLKGKGVELLLDAVINYLPSPLDRPSATLIHKSLSSSAFSHKNVYNINKTVNKQILTANPLNSDFCGLAFKVVHDTNRGYLVFIRIYSGSLSSKQVIFNTTRNTKERINQIVRIDAEDYQQVSEAFTGDVVCLVGLKSTMTGDTLTTEGSSYASYILEGVSIPESVYSVAIEPEKSSQLSDLEKVLEILQVEDPSLRVEHNSESGQIMLKGLGELHIEIVCDKLKRQHNIEVCTGKAYVAYRESLQPDTVIKNKRFVYDKVIGTRRMFASVTLTIESFNTLDELKVEHSEVDNNIKNNSNIKNSKNNESKSHDDVDEKYIQLPFSSSNTTNSSDNSTNKNSTSNSSSSEDRNVVILINKSITNLLSGEEYTSLCEGLQACLFRGPKGYPVMDVKIRVDHTEKDFDTTPGSIRACIAQSIDSIFRNKDYHEFLEPFMMLEIQCPSQFIGAVLSDLTVKRRANIIEVLSSDEDDDSSTRSSSGGNIPTSTLIAHVPLATLLGYSTTIRSLTQGEGKFSMEFMRYISIDFETAQADLLVC